MLTEQSLFAVGIDDDVTVGDVQSAFDALIQAGIAVFFQNQAVDDHVDEMLGVFFQRRHFIQTKDILPFQTDSFVAQISDFSKTSFCVPFSL